MQRTPGIIGLVALVGALLMYAPIALPQDIKATAQPDSSRKKVLVLNSYHPGYLWSDDLVAGILSVLDDGRTDVFIEYLDSKRFVGKEYFDRIEEIIRYKHGNAKIDAIIASDHNAVELILKMRSTFLRGVPLVFCGIDEFSWEHRMEHEPIYGLEEKDGGIFGTLDLVFSVHPRLRAVYFVADETKSAQVMLKYVREAEASQKDGVKFNYLVGMSVAEVETAVQEVPADSVVMWLHFVRDKNGLVLAVIESQQWIAEHSSVPVYCPWGFKAGTGVLGGRILSGFTQGKKAAEIMRQILEKQDPQPIPYGQQAPLTTMFDYEVMRRFGIGMNDIPADSIVHHKPLSALEQYTWQILGIAALVVVLSLLVGFLLIERARRRRASDRLEVAEEKYRSVIENANEAIVVTQDEAVKYCNLKISELTGYSPEEMRSRGFDACIHPEDLEMVLREYRSRISGERPTSSYLTRIITKDGQEKHAFVNSALIDWEGKPASLSMLTDITERKKAENALQQSEHNLAEAQHLAHIGNWWWDIVSNQTHWSTELFQILGVDQQKVKPSKDALLKCVHPDDKPVLEKSIATVLSEHKPFTIDYRIVKPDGSVRFVHSMARLECDAENKPVGLYGILHDITERKMAEEEARIQRENLARMDRATSMGQLTGSISHELNQPLTGILSNAQAAEMMLKKGQFENKDLAGIMAEIAADAKRAGDLIRNLRELYREQKGEFLPVNINAVVKDTTKLLHSEFVMQQVGLFTEFAPSIPMVNGNEIQLQQVLVNLIMNGIQAMSGAAQDDRRLHIETAYHAGEIKAWVEDSGPGIDADKIDHIFEPLTTWKPGGTGMGLAISNSIIEAHGGRMWAENRPEVGARVGFALPVLKEGEKA